MKILIPMAGEGSRFAREGYVFPKPLIDVNGKPMIQRVVENLDFDAEYIFLVRAEHLEKYSGLRSTLQRITDDRCTIVEVDSLTEGAACTCLLAKEHINVDDDLLIANSDQIIEYEKVVINNIDITVLSQVINISKISEAIISNLADLLRIDKQLINVKGKSFDNLGVIGDGQASACIALVSVRDA